MKSCAQNRLKDRPASTDNAPVLSGHRACRVLGSATDRHSGGMPVQILPRLAGSRGCHATGEMPPLQLSGWPFGAACAGLVLFASAVLPPSSGPYSDPGRGSGVRLLGLSTVRFPQQGP
jgi:hypothetical protein